MNNLLISKVRKRRIEKDVYEALQKFNYIPKKKQVFIKPNIVSHFKPDSPYLTNPRIIAGIIDYLRSRGVEKIYVGDGPSSEDSDDVFSKSGYKKLCKEKKVELVDLNKTEFINVKWKYGELGLPKIILESEYINVAKLKTHMQATVSFCLKNQKGLISLRDKMRFHRDGLDKHIVGLYEAIKPDLSMIDATNGLEGNGPGVSGTPVKNINLLIIGKDALETDYLACRLIGLDPKKVVHLKMAAGNKNIKLPNNLLKEIEKNQLHFKLPYCNGKFQILNLTYWLTNETCSQCNFIVGELKKNLMKHPIVMSKLFYYLITHQKINFVTGKSKIPDAKGKIICMGNCAMGNKNVKPLPGQKIVFVPGCPPKIKDLIKNL